MAGRRLEVAALMASLSAVAALAVACGDLPNSLPTRPHNPGNGDGGETGEGGTGPSTSSGPPPATAQGMFEQVVYPQLNQDCGACHIDGIGTPYFLAYNATDAYTLVKGLPGYVTDPTQSRLMLKPEHSGGQAPALTETQKDLVRDWLLMELETDPPDPDDPPAELTPVQQLEKFASCMSFADWETFQVATLVSNSQAIYQNNSVECDSCHDNGESGAIITAESIKMFDMTKQMPFILKLASVTLNDDGTYKGIAAANRWIEKCTEPQLVGNPHPPCQNGALDTEVVAAINAFFDATKTRFDANQCETATLPPGP